MFVKLCQFILLNACFSYFAFQITHFAKVLENFAQTCACTSATFRSSAVWNLSAPNFTFQAFAQLLIFTRSLFRVFDVSSFSKIIITPLLGPRPDVRECVTSMIFQELLVFLLGGLGGGVPNWKSHSDFFCFQKIFFSKTSWWLVINRKKFCLVKRYYCEFFYK